jgi:hypothetical protein
MKGNSNLTKKNATGDQFKAYLSCDYIRYFTVTNFCRQQKLVRNAQNNI